MIQCSLKGNLVKYPNSRIFFEN